MVKEEATLVPYQDKQICAMYSKPDVASNGYGLILTHGAGGDMNNHQLKALASYMSERGFLVLRFTCKGLNIDYRTKVYHQVLSYFHEENKGVKGCFLAGKSMGSRAAVAVANLVKDTDLVSYVRGVVCLSYPLYPTGQLDKMRDKPLKELEYPTLFLSGTKDDMAKSSLLEKAVATIPREAKIYWIEGANHGHKVPGRKAEEVNEEVFLQMAEWCHYMMGLMAKSKPGWQNLSMSAMRDTLKMTDTPVGSREAQATSTEYTHTDRGKDGSQKGSLPSSPQKASAAVAAAALPPDSEKQEEEAAETKEENTSPPTHGRAAKSKAATATTKRAVTGETETGEKAKKPRVWRGRKK